MKLYTFVMPLLVVFFVLAEVIWQISIKYPPTLEQLNFFVTSPLLLWSVRTFCFILITVSAYFAGRMFSGKRKLLVFIIILSSPLISVIWMSYPQDVLVMFITVTLFYLLSNKGSLLVATVLCILLVTFMNIIVLKEKPNIIENLSFKNAQAEISFRFIVEDGLKPKINLPLKLKRLVYNKYFFVIKNTINESLNFFDFETLFFQEVHPLGQKAMVVFYWPEFYLFLVGIWYLTRNRKKQNPILISFLIISFFYFLTKNAPVDRRLALSVFPISLMIGSGIDIFFNSKNLYLRFSVGFFIFLSLYGWITNYYDRTKRPDFWLDNRPLTYDFILNYIKSGGNNFKQIIYPDTLYALKIYCPFYLDKCDNLSIGNFDLTKENPQQDYLYAGFGGNFSGKSTTETGFPELEKQINGKDMTILAHTRILNNIASGFGQELILAEFAKSTK